MKKIYLISLFAACATMLSAQEKIDLESRAVLQSYREGTLSPKMEKAIFLSPLSRGSNPTVKVLVKTDGSLPADMPYNYYKVSDEFYTVDIPVDEIEDFSNNDEIVTMTFGRVASASMDIARTNDFGEVDRVHDGFALGDGGGLIPPKRPYKGTGVVVGMYDTGFDPSHINWLTADGTANRLKYFIRVVNGMNEFYGDDAAKQPTDALDETHGTHVAGIMAGSYNGPGKYYGDSKTDKGVINLYGVAPEAEMAVAAGQLSSSYIIEGVSRIADYAKNQGKPVVINLSLGHNTGPHDGTDTESQAIDAVAKNTGAIILVAAGNDGDIACHAGTTFTAAKKSTTVLFANNRATSNVDVWSSDGNPITVSFVAIDPATGQVKAKVSSNPNTTTTVGGTADADNSFFNDNFTGNARMQSGVSRLNGRYEVYISASLRAKDAQNPGALLGLMIEGSEGVRVDAYGSENVYFQANPTLLGIDRADMNGSISDLACGFNTICIGSYNTRNSWYDLYNDNQISYIDVSGAVIGQTSGFSSWGELIDGRKLPHVCAPGQRIVSSFNTGYVNGHHYSDYEVMGCATVNGSTYYWGGAQGTSMACPFAAGTIALWLEMDPTLTRDGIIDIINKTADKNNLTLNTKWGAGKLKAWAGIREVKSRKQSGIGNVTVGGSDDFDITVTGGSIEVFAAGAGQLSVELYTVGGALAAATEANGETAELSTDGLAKGVYVLHATDGNRKVSRKIAF